MVKGESSGRVFVANGLPRKGLATGTLISAPELEQAPSLTLRLLAFSCSRIR